MKRRYCLTLDLKNDPDLIRSYEEYHRKVWPEIIVSIRESGITEMEIYRKDTRLFMVMEADESFSFERKQAMDAMNQKVQEWEQLMWNFQQPLNNAPPGAKWILMEPVFKLSDYK
jgi:L-rhamnose mutarotase